MTKKEFYEKYGDVKVKFYSYHKYNFTYVGDLPDGGRISVDYGGNGDDIYGFDVAVDYEETINSLEPNFGIAYDKDGKKVDEFYDY